MAFLSATPASAALITIDFEDLGVALGDQLNPAAGVSQDSGGFTFTPGPNNAGGFNDLHFHNQDGIGDNGSTHLGTHDDVVMTRVGGGAFTLLGFEFQGFINEPESFFLHAVRQDLTGFAVSFLPDSLVALPYDVFSVPFDAIPPLDFINVVSLTWEVPAGFGEDGFFLENIRVEIDENGRVPEPAGVTLLLVGLVALYRRRRS
jgi:hypothetical protein